nr:metallophosphoesterase [Bacillus suaedae]
MQVTDLHEKEFGEKQNRLIEAIESIDYDMLAFTGDLLDDSRSLNYPVVYSLIEGLQQKENAFYIPGNADPTNYIRVGDRFEKNEFAQGLEKRGVQLLEGIQFIKRGDSSLFFTHFDESVFPADRVEAINQLDDNETLIALNHYPIVDIRMDHLANDRGIEMGKYDLLIAGHYHGGQLRLPFLGAFFVPEAWYERSGLFPPQDRVKGWWEYRGVQQYVSAGLGTSDAISFLAFRLFNPPEINKIVLRRG